jgi:hypothetical protein
VSTALPAARETHWRLLTAQLLGEKLLQRAEQSPIVALIVVDD